MKKIPIKNYVILVVLIAVTVLAACYGCYVYKKHQEHGYVTVMLPFLKEIKEDGIGDYLVDNPTAVLYISDKTNSSLEEEELKVKQLITDYNLQSYFVYVDISNDQAKSLADFEKKYQLQLNYQNLPILVIIEDEQVVEYYNEQNWNAQEIEDFLVRNGVIEND